MIFECFVYPTIIKHLYSSTKQARKIRSRVFGYAEEAAHILGTNSLSIISQLLTQNTVILNRHDTGLHKIGTFAKCPALKLQPKKSLE